MSALQSILEAFRAASKSEREKGNYFENLAKLYFTHEPKFADLYSRVWVWEEWREERIQAGHADPGTDTGIDLVAQTQGTGEFHAIQAKFYDSDSTVYKRQVDSFFTASGKKPFTQRLLILSTDKISPHVDAAMQEQNTPCQKLTLADLEASVIDWAATFAQQTVRQRPRKELRDYQQSAVQKVMAGLQDADRGKLIMACGTGKTFTALRLAEAIAGAGGRVLFLVPSLALLSQSLTEWTQEAGVPMHGFAVCSDSDVGKKRSSADDDYKMLVHELQYPATTNAKSLAHEVGKRHDDQHMSVVFSTYHSIDVISLSQHQHHLADFDLIICDEAHRTTGATYGDEDESAFVKVHSQDTIKARKRVYMTATPRIYGDSAKATAERDNVALFSMDNEAIFGHELFVITFSEAVSRGLLVDYKVIVLSVEEAHINRRLQKLLADDNNQLRVDDAAKIVGCWKALSKHGLADELTTDPDPMHRAVAFCQVIEIQKGAKTHKVSSKNIAGMFQAVVEAYQESAEEDDPAGTLHCEAEHVDGGMNASQKEAKLSWLKAAAPEDTCRILSNVRCLSEGVDVPALDAVIFLTPRNSQVDVVQSVGRVMRNAPGKKRGYVILPVVIPAGVEAHEALNDNKTYAVVWQVLQALRSHDDRFDAFVNKLDLIGRDAQKMEVIAITDKVAKKPAKAPAKKTNRNAGKGGFTIGEPDKPASGAEQAHLPFEIGEIERAIYAKLVQKCGNRHHWEDWANDIAKIARTHIDRITAIVEDASHVAEREAFHAFAKELRDDLNGSISDAEVIEMLAQHLITKPVFDALFADYSFAQHNPMSLAMQGVLDVLHEHRLGKETDTLQKFYDSVKMRAAGIDSAAGKQKIVVELYDKFFRNAFPKMTERLGIVYTPVEVVDFIIHSVSHILESEFGQTLGSEGVHIIDPFTGTGTFITRLLQSGLIAHEHLPHKYKKEIHANELVLLAYYIAAINIEAVYHGIVGGEYQPFEGICLTDTFQMYEKEDLVEALLVDNSARRKRQKRLDIRVIMGNPPYSAGQMSANDNNQNVEYPDLDGRIRSTYAQRSGSANLGNLYDSYIRAIRWASDRVGTSGVIGFVTNASFLETGTFDGMRKCLAEEFSSIYLFHLRGNQRTAGERSRQEGGKVFGSGSRAPIAISLLVKNPAAAQQGQVYFYDIGDYLSREEKLARIAALTSIAGITTDKGWQVIAPDAHGDWLKQRDDSFTDHIVLGDKKGSGLKLFKTFSLGVVTNRDSWCYSASKAGVASNIARMIDFYNAEAVRLTQAHPGLDKKQREVVLQDFISTDATKIAWTRALKQDLAKGKHLAFDGSCLVTGLYRPFNKQWLYFNRDLNEMVLQMPRFFPSPEARNRIICVSGAGSRKGFSTLIADQVFDLNCFDAGAQCFPLYVYGEGASARNDEESSQSPLFSAAQPDSHPHRRQDAITSEGLAHFQGHYRGESITREDVFYYVYGLLHSPDYRERFADNLGKELPRIPRVRTAEEFWMFCRAGRKLADLHLNYETAPLYPVTIDTTGKSLTDADYRVEQMKYGKTGKDKDLTTLQYNAKIALRGIPLEAYDYIVNGKPALDWVVERQRVKTDKDSGIVNDANDWATETVGNPRYPLELFQRVITVSLETMKIIRGLPPLDIAPSTEVAGASGIGVEELTGG